MNQLSFLDIPKPKPSGEILRDKGIARAVKHAEDTNHEWSKKALDFLYLYARTHNRFSGEMVRQEAGKMVPTPPSLRAWGSVLLQGSRRGWIKQVGFIKVNNPLAHKTPATLWESLL
jgi:hypothetical protein